MKSCSLQIAFPQALTLSSQQWLLNPEAAGGKDGAEGYDDQDALEMPTIFQGMLKPRRMDRAVLKPRPKHMPRKDLRRFSALTSCWSWHCRSRGLGRNVHYLPED